MRNAEAARYARFAGIVAILLSVAVAAVFISRSVRQASARRHGPKPVPSSVQQSSAQFSYSKVEKDRTIYTIQASQATQFKDQDLSVLQDVVVTMYGEDGNRNDTIHTRECSYEPGSGKIRCQGAVQIEIHSAADQASPTPRSLHVETSDVTFDRDTGVAMTTQPVKFKFPNGEGKAVGLNYQSKNGVLQLEHEVVLSILQPEKPNAIPVVLNGDRLDYNHDERIAYLEGSVHARQGNRNLSAQKMSLDLDAEMRARHAVAQGNPQFDGFDGVNPVSLKADRFDAELNVAGWIEKTSATGNVHVERKSPAGVDQLNAQAAEVAMEPKINQPRDLNLSGGVKMLMHGASNSGHLETAAMQVHFVPGANPTQRRIESATTLAPVSIDSVDADSSTNVHANSAHADFDAQNRIRKFYGDSGVQVTRKTGTSAPQKTTAQQMVAAFDETGGWQTIQLDGKVHFTQADRVADAQRALMTKSSDTIALDGSPILRDAASQTSAAAILIRQQGDYVSAKGSVRSTYLASSAATSPSIGTGSAHISADSLAGSSTTGILTYTGHARMWQGDSVLEANTIELFRDEKRVDAKGNVVAVFPQAASSIPPGSVQPASAQHASAQPGTPQPGTAQLGSANRGPAQTGAPVTLWKVRAPMLRYWNDLGRAHLEDGVFAESADQSLKSRTLDLFLSPATAPVVSTPTSTQTATPTATPTAKGMPLATGGRQLIRALALGNVIVHQADRRGSAERADYTAADEKFVLSGGEPTLTDAENDTTTGRSLTFYRASDTIFIDSAAGSRTLTKHQVEK
jgi:LPS export ABC transporter protein LptC